MRLTTLSLSFALACSAWGAHLPGGSITYNCLGSNQYEVTLQLWRECTGAPMIGQALDFTNNCGVSFTLNNIPLISTEDASPVCEDQVDQTTCNGGPLIGIQLYTYRTTLFLSPCNAWTIGWDVCCRNTSVNLVGEQGIYIEARLNNLGGACYTSPTFTENRPPFACVDQPVSYDLGVTGGSQADLRFRLIAARRALPGVEDVSYQFPYTGSEPFPGLVLDSISGNISFTPTIQGYIVVVVEVNLYDANGVWRGSIMRDFPFVAEVCSNQVPDAASGTVTVTQGDAVATGDYVVGNCSSNSFCLAMEVVDADAGQELTLTSNVDLILPGATFNVTGTNPAMVTICWDPAGATPGTRTFSISALDNACPVRGSQTFSYTVNLMDGGGSAGSDATAELCPGGSIDLSPLVTGDTGGVWSNGPLVGAIGEYTYTITTSCGSDEAVFTVVDAVSPDAGADASTAICEGTSVDLSTLVTGSSGGVWGSGSSVVNMAGDYIYTVTNSCEAIDDAIFTVVVVQEPYAGDDASIMVCASASVFALTDSLGGAPEAGGEWQFGGANHADTFDPTMDLAGTYLYFVPGVPPCSTVAVAILTIEYLDSSDPYCISLGTPDLQRPSFSIEPNPTTGSMRIVCGEVPRGIELLDAQGRILLHVTAETRSATTTLELPAALANGVYLLRLQDQHGEWSSRHFELLR